ncbi:acetylxylan esterase [Clostridium sp. NSJ-49]|uniref:acetylxylan esterase n=1 Tax=Clostridium TaxID=1485 RepID=UPI00164C33D1|nr:alpha/beta fold hydrolase [Clostridium sp. NSJ-49]MBC5625564.1 acetylxylan esterase [Clostridium sp. NSJ-49]MDU6339944.1 acetylxylan esterase [Clostridium sp.]
MPIVDMPLERLREYKGTNTLPRDFSEFWNERINEVKNHPLKYKITESEIRGFEGCEFLELWFKGIDGGKVYAKYIRPKTDEDVPLILQFHGYPGASRGWFEQLSFVGMGCAIIAMDCPGQGGNGDSFTNMKGTTVSGHIVAGLDGDICNMYYVKLFQNASILCRIVKELNGIDKERIYANGASQGAGIALVCAALNPIIKKCAALYPFLSDYKRVWDMDLDMIAYEGLRYYSRWFNSMNDKEDEMFTKLGYIDVHNFADMINCEVLFGTGLMDNVCPPSTQFAIYNNIGSKKKHIIFPDYTHEEIGEFDDMLIDFFLKEDD